MIDHRFAVRAIPALLVCAASGYAGAAGFALIEQNASGIGNAYAGSAASAENASTIYFNPAGMTKLREREFSAGIAAVRPSLKFSDGGSNIGTATASGAGDAGDWAAIPNAFASWNAAKNWYVGVGISAPFGLKTEYDPNWVGRFQAESFEIQSINLNPSVAYRVNDTVSLGFGANWQRFQAIYKRKAAVLNALTQATDLKLDADDDSWGWNAGALFDISPATRIGVSYRSSIKHTLEGTLTSSNQLVAQDVNAKAEIKLPDTFIVSVSQALNERWTMLGDLSWAGWGKIQKVEIVRTTAGTSAGTGVGTVAQTLDTKFRDAWRVAFGGVYKYSDAWDLKFGIAYDQTPVQSAEQRLVSLPDNNRLWLSAGAVWKPAKDTRVDLGAAYLYVRDTDIANNQATAGRGLVVGKYDSSIWILGAQYSQSF
jgi:long-chain fatty acid transport protein